MKNLVSIAAVAASFVALPTVANAQRVPAASVVVVDTSRIYRECTACRTAQTSLQSQMQTLQTRARTLQQQIETEGKPLETAVAALNGKAPDAALQQRITAFQTRQRNAEQELARSQQNIQSIQANVLRQINAQLNPAVNQVMTARGANLAVDVEATLAHTGALNATNDVLAALNRALPSVSLTPLPQQQQTPQPQGR